MLEEPLRNVMHMEETPCPIGCSPCDEYVLSGVDRLHGLPGEFRVVRCTSCGLMRTDPRPTIESIGHYYPAEYSPHQADSASARTGTVIRLLTTLRRIQPSWLRNRRLPAVPPGRLLEIGCAAGGYLQEMKSAGWDVSGVEPSQSAAAAANAAGLDVFHGSISSLPQESGRYDVIVGWMVLEHLHDPVGGLKKLREQAANDGWLVLSVPDATGWLGFSFFRSYWYALDLPRHLFQFTPHTLKTVLEAAGWKQEKIYWQHDASNFFWSLRYWLLERKLATLAALCDKIGRRRGNPIVACLAVLLGVFHCSGRMVVWAQPDLVRKEERSAL